MAALMLLYLSQGFLFSLLLFTLLLRVHWRSDQPDPTHSSLPMAVAALARGFSALTVFPRAPSLSCWLIPQGVSGSIRPCLLSSLAIREGTFTSLTPGQQPWCGIHTSISLDNNKRNWLDRSKYTVRPIGMRKTGGRDHTGKIKVDGIGGGHKQRYRMIDFQRLRYEPGKEGEPFEEKVVQIRYDPCRSADIALLAGGSRKRWIIATENMEAGDVVKTSGLIGRMAGM
ncbi:large ribosomal subunit protein uL2m, partial [Cetorhinus maximus]